MGRWKYNSQNELAWDENDSGPDQGAPTDEQKQSQAASQATAGAKSPLVDWAAKNPTSSQYSNDWSYKTDPSSIQAGGTTEQTMPNGAIGNTPQPPVIGMVDPATGKPYSNVPTGWDAVNSQAGTPENASNPSGAPATPASATPTATPGATPAGTPQYQYMEGVDTGKLNDQSHTSPKYLIARQLASGVPVSEAIKAVPGTVQLDATRFRLPTGETIDTRRDEEGANALQWLVTDDPNAAASGAGSVTGSAGANGSPNGQTGAGGFGASGSGSGSSIVDFLMKQILQDKNPSAKDPIIANQVNAYSAQTQRADRNAIDEAAERGGPYANLSMERRMAAENEGQATGAFQAQLMGQELQARRNEIQQALSGMLGYISDDKKLALQQYLAQIDNALNYSRLGQEAYEFDSNDEYRRSPLAS